MSTCPPCTGDCNQGRDCPADDGVNLWPVMFVLLLGFFAVIGWAAVAIFWPVS
jgi:hypothetical protein